MALLVEDLIWHLSLLLTTCVPGASFLVAVNFSFLIWLIGSTGISHFLALRFIVSCKYCVVAD